MGNYDSGRASNFGGINIELRRADSLNGLRFNSNRADPTSANDVILYRGAGNTLKFWDGSNVTILLGSVGGLLSVGTVTVTSVDALALAVGRVGATNPVLAVDASTALVATGISIKGAAAAGGVALAAISSGVAEALTIDAKGTGGITLAGTSTGAITLGAAVSIAAAKTVTFAAGAGALDMLLATGGLKLETGTVTGALGAATLNKLSGVVTTEALATAAAGTQLYTITNSQSAAADKIFVNVSTAGTGEPVCSNVIPGAGSFTVLIKNVSAATAFNAAVKIYFMVLKTA